VVSLFSSRAKVATVVESAGPPVDVRAVDALDLAEARRLTALSGVDKALAAYATTRRVSDLTDGLLDVRNRLTRGMPS
jgi:hypothetical protein